MVRIGAWIPNRGSLPRDPGITHMARVAEEAGFDSATVSDHVVMPAHTTSYYPFAADGVATWDPRDPWYDAIVAMSMCVAVTSRIDVGVGVLVLPLRHPIVLAKQIASLDALSGGRVTLGVGAGWLEEEFDALAVPFDSRGRRLDEWIELLRGQWSGEPHAFAGTHYDLPADVLAYPRPERDVPIIVGGMSRAALRRAADSDGWFALQRVDALDPDEIAAGVAAIDQRRGDRPAPRVVLRVLGDPDEFAPRFGDFVAAGVTEVVVNVDLTDLDVARATRDRLREASRG